MIIKRRFVCEEHSEYGEIGWRPLWQPTFDPYTGQAIPHDMLEHKLRGAGAEDEFMALGAAWLIRGKTGWFQRRRGTVPPHSHIAADFPEIFRRIAYQGQTLNDPGNTRPMSKSVDEGLVEAVIFEGFKSVEDESDAQLDRLISDESKRRVAGWLRRGMRWAYSRYRNYDFHDIAYLIFTPILNKADELLGQAGEGDIMLVKADLDCNTVQLEIEEAI